MKETKQRKEKQNENGISSNLRWNWGLSRPRKAFRSYDGQSVHKLDESRRLKAATKTTDRDATGRYGQS